MLAHLPPTATLLSSALPLPTWLKKISPLKPYLIWCQNMVARVISELRNLSLVRSLNQSGVQHRLPSTSTNMWFRDFRDAPSPLLCCLMSCLVVVKAEPSSLRMHLHSFHQTQLLKIKCWWCVPTWLAVATTQTVFQLSLCHSSGALPSCVTSQCCEGVDISWVHT